MKKLWKLALVALIAVLCLSVFAACDLFGGGDGDKDEDTDPNGNGTETEIEVTEKLVTPTDLKIDGTMLTWGAVEGASGYSLNIDVYDKSAEVETVHLTKETTAASYDLAELTEQKAYDIKVSATCGQEEFNSDFSEIKEYVTLPETEGLEYTLIENDTAYALVDVGDVKDVVIVMPPEVNNLPITDIYAQNTAVGVFTNKVKKVIISESVTSIGNSAFNNCTSLTSITIPNSVTSIGWDAFDSCTGLTSITIPNSVTSIGGYAFSDCTGLTSITIPNSVTSIGNSAFRDCSGLTSIAIPESVASIGGGAFAYCMDLTEINFNATAMEDFPLTSGGHIFYDAGKNAIGITLNIGANVTKIPLNLFYPRYNPAYTLSGLPKIIAITVLTMVPPTLDSLDLRNVVSSTAKIYVPASSVDLYKTATGWKNYASRIYPIEE